MFTKHKKLKYTAFIMDVVLILCLTIVFAGIYAEFGRNLFLQKEKEHQRLIQNMVAVFDDFIAREFRQVKVAMPFLDDFSTGSGKKDALWNDIKFLQSFFKVDSQMVVTDIFFSADGNLSAGQMDLSASRIALCISKSQKLQTDIITPMHTSLMTGKDCIGFVFPCKSGVFVAELDINGIFDLIDKTGLLDLYRDAIILLLKPDSSEIIYRSSRGKYPYWEFSPTEQKIQIGDEEYYYARRILADLNVQLVVLTPEKYYTESFDLIKKYLVSLIVIVLVFYIFRGVWTDKSFYMPLSRFLGSIKKDAMSQVTLDSAYEEWSDFEKIYNNAIKKIRRYSDELRQSEKKYRDLFDLAPDGMCITSFEGEIIYFNKNFQNMFKYSDSELKNRPIQDLYMDHEADRPVLLDRLAESQKLKNYEIIFVDASGNKIHTSCSLVIINYEGRNCIETTVRDITKEKEREKEILHLKAYLNNIIESMPSMLITVDTKGRVTQWNQAAVKAVKGDVKNIYGQKLWDISPYFAKYANEIDNISKTRRSKTFHRELLSNGEDRYFNVTLFPLVSNGVEGIALRADDITEIEKREQQFRQSQKMELVGTLAGGLAHDFNNVLTGIIGTISLIQYEIKNDHDIQIKELEKYLATMEKAGQRATEMVRQLLTVTRKQELFFAVIDLNSAVRNVMEICKNSFDKSVELNPVFTEKPAMTHADPAQSEQVLLNLRVNACHAMTIMRGSTEKWGGKLVVSMEKIVAGDVFCTTHPEAQKTTYWMLTISDTGIGMEPLEVEKIFDPFFTTKKMNEGTGLGMSMVYNIIKQHEGFIDIFSQKGMGTTVNIYLPVAEGKITEKEKYAKINIAKGKGLILVVDDEKLIRKTAKRILEKCGYDVIAAEDGEKGVKLFQEKHDQIRAVVLDMIMSDMSGKEAFTRMIEIDPKVNVILASGFRQDERVQEVMQLGVKSFIHKPYTMEKLTQAVNEAL